MLGTSATKTLRRIAGTLAQSHIDYRRSRFVRYLGKRRRVGTPTAGAIDEIHPVTGAPGLLRHHSGVDVVAYEPLYIRGWAIDEGRRALGWDIRFEIDGRAVPADVRARQPRPDIVRAFASPAVLACGFEAFVSTTELAVGPHEIGVRVTVGRRGAAFAPLVSSVPFFVHALHAPNVAQLDKHATTRWFRLESVLPTPAGTMLTVKGWALDGHRRFLSAVAARIDDGPWHTGWTGVNRHDLAAQAGHARLGLGGFGLRIPLAAIAPGEHLLEVIGKSERGAWIGLGLPQPIIVTTVAMELRSYARPLAHGGEAAITRIDNQERPCVRSHRMKSGQEVHLAGLLRRSSPAGPPAALIAQRSDGREFRLPAWSAPAGNPNVLRFGATIAKHALSPGSYRLAVEAPDATLRFVGRADTQCELQVDPDVTTAAASRIKRLQGLGPE